MDRRAAEILEIPDVDRMDIGRWAGHPAVDLSVERVAPAWRSSCGRRASTWGPTANPGGHRERPTPPRRHGERARPTENSNAIDSVTVIGPDRTASASRPRVRPRGRWPENPRSLLASTGRLNTAWVSRDLVGRFYMEHPRTQASARSTSEAWTGSDRSAPGLAEDSTPEHGTVSRVTFRRQMQRDEELFESWCPGRFRVEHSRHRRLCRLRRLAARARGRDVDDIGRDITSSVASDVRDALKDSPALVRHGAQCLQKRALPTSMVLDDEMEQEPDPLSRVTLDRSRRDRWGSARVWNSTGASAIRPPVAGPNARAGPGHPGSFGHRIVLELRAGRR